MKLKTCCFTGHRQLPNKDQNQIARKLESSIELLIQSGYLYFGTGGTLGFDYEKRKVMRSEVLDTAQ